MEHTRALVVVVLGLSMFFTATAAADTPDVDLLSSQTAQPVIVSTPPLDDVIAQTLADLENQARLAAEEAARVAALAAEEAAAREAANRRLTAAAPATPLRAVAAVGDSVWDALAACECSGNWSCNTGNGYSGGLQFVHSTWVDWGGLAYAAEAWMASREEQIAVASGHAWSNWPACARKLGLL